MHISTRNLCLKNLSRIQWSVQYIITPFSADLVSAVFRNAFCVIRVVLLYIYSVHICILTKHNFYSFDLQLTCLEWHNIFRSNCMQYAIHIPRLPFKYYIVLYIHPVPYPLQWLTPMTAKMTTTLSTKGKFYNSNYPGSGFCINNNK